MNVFPSNLRRTWHRHHLAVILVIASILPFAHSLGHDLLSNWDDQLNITENYPLQSPDALRQIWTPGVMPSFQPISYTFFRIQYKLWGLHPLGYHAVSLLLHALGTLAAFAALRLLVTRTTAFWTVLLWAIHPLRAEPVNWVSEQRTLLAGILFWLALSFFIRYLRRHRPLHLAAGTTIYAAACLTKLLVAGLAPVLLLTGYLIRTDKKRTWACVLLTGAVAAVVGVVAALSEPRSAWSALSNIPPFLHIFIAIYSLVFYAGKTLFPFVLLPAYPFPQLIPPGLPLLTAILTVIAIVIFFQEQLPHRRLRTPILALGAYTLTLLPLSGLLPIPFLSQSYTADRYAYIPGVFLTLLLVHVTRRIMRTRPALSRRLASPAIAVWVTACCMLSLSNSAHWKNAPELWQHALRHYPLCIPAHTNLGTWYTDNGFLFKGLAHYSTHLHLEPLSPLANYDMGVVLAKLGDLPAAERYYRQALHLYPGYAEAAINLANTLLKMNRLEEASYFIKLADESNKGNPAVNKAIEINRQLLGSAVAR